ncbi:MAG: hypothetical protein KAX78_04455 [Phycisphaerae bacterium]|nr:hypothetical protein [Phycisphaerae bacterium]
MRSRPNSRPLPDRTASGQLPSLDGAVRRCRCDEQFLTALGEIYARADAEIGALGAECLGGGSCCRFDLTAHRLYLSCGELAYLTAQTPPSGQRIPTRRCPYQVGPRCSARGRRPLGCRAYFCDKKSRNRRSEIYEQYHGEIRALHRAHGLDYLYVELTAGVQQMFGRPCREHFGIDKIGVAK